MTTNPRRRVLTEMRADREPESPSRRRRRRSPTPIPNRRFERRPLTPPPSPDDYENLSESELTLEPTSSFNCRRIQQLQTDSRDAELTNRRQYLDDFFSANQNFNETELLENHERDSAFWQHYSTVHLGNILSFRRATDPVDLVDKIYVKRENFNGKSSIIKMRSSELEEFLATSLLPMYEKLQQPNLQKFFGATCTHNFKDEAFWRHSCVVTNPSGDIKVRAFFSDGRVLIRIWQQIGPVQIRNAASDDKVTWTGPNIRLTLGQFKGFLQKLYTLLGEYWEEQSGHAR